MTPTKALLLRLPAAFAAASLAVGAAQACGPMDGGGGMPQGGSSQDGSAPQSAPPPYVPPPPSAPPQGGFGGGASQGGGGGASWDNAGAEQMRQSAAATAAGGDAGGDSGPRRSSGAGSGGSGGSQDFSSQISALGAADAKANQPAQAAQAAASEDGSDGHTGGGNSVWWTMLTGDNGLEHSLNDNQPPGDDPRYRAQMDKPWYQRAWEAAQVLAPGEGYEIPATGGGNNVWWTMLTGDNGLEHSLTDNLPKYEDPNANPAWKAWNDLPWYEKWTTPEPSRSLPPLPYHPPTANAGVRG